MTGTPTVYVKVVAHHPTCYITALKELLGEMIKQIDIISPFLAPNLILLKMKVEPFAVKSIVRWLTTNTEECQIIEENENEARVVALVKDELVSTIFPANKIQSSIGISDYKINIPPVYNFFNGLSSELFILSINDEATLESFKKETLPAINRLVGKDMVHYAICNPTYPWNLDPLCSAKDEYIFAMGLKADYLSLNKPSAFDNLVKEFKQTLNWDVENIRLAAIFDDVALKLLKEGKPLIQPASI